MGQRRNTPPRFRNLLQVNHRADNAWIGAAFRDHVPPWPDDQAVTEGFPAVPVLAALAGRDDEGAVLDGARHQQSPPMGLAPSPG